MPGERRREDLDLTCREVSISRYTRSHPSSLWVSTVMGLLATLVLSIACAPAAAAESTIPPSTPPGPNADGRAYEMVTPPDKPTRRGGNFFPTDALAAYPGVPSVRGDSMLLGLAADVLTDDANGSLGWSVVRLLRADGGWNTQPIFDRPVLGSAYAASAQVIGAGAGQEDAAITSNYPLFAEQGGVSASGYRYTRFLGDSPTWADAPGWSIWAPTVDSASKATNGSALFAGRFAVRAGSYNCLLGSVTDPSCAQTSGAAVYRQDLTDGSRELVSACTGTGGDATLIPARAGTGVETDMLDAQPCEQGSMPSVRGAMIGGGGNGLGSPLNPSLGGPAANAVSEDGSRVFFTSPDPSGAAGLPTSCRASTGAATDCPPQLYVRQWDSSGEPTTRWISRPEVTGQRIAELGAGVGYEGASDDGSIVYFRTNAPLVAGDPNGGQSITDDAASPNSWDLYRYELPPDPDADPATGTLTRISGGPGGSADANTTCASLTGSGNCGNGIPTATLRYLSDDGTRAYFVTAAPLPGADNAPPEGSAPDSAPGGTAINAATRNLYLFDASESGAERWKFITQLPFAPRRNLDSCASASPTPGGTFQATGGGANSGLRLVENSCVYGAEVAGSGGDVITFMTSGRLTPDDDDSAFDVYAYDSEADRLTRISSSQGGSGGESYTCATEGGDVQCNADLGFLAGNSIGGEAYRGPDGLRHLMVSTEGAVYFETRRSLIARDVNGSRMDVYQWQDGDLSLVSPGDSDDDSYLSGASVDGRDVFFQTSKPIDPREIDSGDFDIYDARIGGGFPYTPPPEECVGDDCQGPRSGSNPGEDPGSGGYEGAGNRGADRGKARRCGRLDRRRARAARRAERLTRRATRSQRAAQRHRRRARRASGSRAKRLGRQVRAERRQARALRRRAGYERRQIRNVKRKMGRCERGNGR